MCVCWCVEVASLESQSIYRNDSGACQTEEKGSEFMVKTVYQSIMVS